MEQTFIDLIIKQGLGVASFAALIFFGYKTAIFATSFVENHMTHLQESLDKLTDNSTESNRKMDKIIEQTKK